MILFPMKVVPQRFNIFYVKLGNYYFMLGSYNTSVPPRHLYCCALYRPTIFIFLPLHYYFYVDPNYILTFFLCF